MQLAEEAGGGEVDILDPMDLTNNFSKLLTNEVIASNVIIKIKLHQLLRFRNENPDFLDYEETTFIKWIGNVTEESLITFEYTFQKIAKMLSFQKLDLQEIKELPFQVQISYDK